MKQPVPTAPVFKISIVPVRVSTTFEFEPCDGLEFSRTPTERRQYYPIIICIGQHAQDTASWAAQGNRGFRCCVLGGDYSSANRKEGRSPKSLHSGSRDYG